jgi:hypothetical protein
MIKAKTKNDFGAIGDNARFLGASVQQGMAAKDSQGVKAYEGDNLDTLKEVGVSIVRYWTGTHSYDVGANDPVMQEVINDVLPALDADHVITWAPQLPISRLGDFVTDRTIRIDLGNEPPIHRDKWATPQEYIDWCVSVVDAYPEYRHLFFVQCGKPEFLGYIGVSDSQKAYHRALLEQVGHAVKNGPLQGLGVSTTHKIYPGQWLEDRMDFYDSQIEDYRAYFGNDIRIAYTEFKASKNFASGIDLQLIAADALLTMCKLRRKYGDTVVEMH